MTDTIAQCNAPRIGLDYPLQTFIVRVRGTVQGVGFRPTVWRLAQRNGLLGEVRNDAEGVLIKIACTAAQVDGFIQDLKNETPPLAYIDTIEIKTVKQVTAFSGFHIVESLNGDSHTQVTPDAACCEACRAEIFNLHAHRYRYPFTNCTHCGPRLSIIKTIPYDRAHTTMAAFNMCEYCKKEYSNPRDRRFHAQPIACAQCGPAVSLERYAGVSATLHHDDAIQAVVACLHQGQIIAIRGLGGYHLACDATNDAAVSLLRKRKRRYAKPFALMAHSIEMIRRYCDINEMEQQCLLSAQAPIVLLSAHGREKLPMNVAPQVTGSNALLGFMLPYTPLHLLITQHMDRPLVMTSANLADEPQIIDNDNARAKLITIADAILLHNRDIANRIDDSVVRCFAGKARLLRRARGYAPRAIRLPQGFAQAPDLLALGGELKATFCLLKAGEAIVSQHQGDLENPDTFDDYQKNLGLYRSLYDHKPMQLVCDLHPEYISSKLAHRIADDNKMELLQVQHHHAHIASCMAENEYPLNAPRVLGIALDGIGYGDDGTFWGGEFMLANYQGYTRMGTFKPIPLIGGMQAMREPWRNTYAHLQAAFTWPYVEKHFAKLELTRYLQSKPLAMLDKMLDSHLNVPLASSCGRLFDAVTAAVDLYRDVAHFEGQGAMTFEALANGAQSYAETEDHAYPFLIDVLDTGHSYIEPKPMWSALLEDLAEHVPINVIAVRFHQGLATALVSMVKHLAIRCRNDHRAFDTVVLSGGCFQNKVLLELVMHKIENAGFRCLTQALLPSNDGGLSLGQAAVAASRALNK